MPGPAQVPSELLASIYEAAARPESWQRVLESASTWVGGIAGSFQARMSGARPAAMFVSSGIGAEFHDAYARHHCKHDPHLAHINGLDVGRGLLSCEVVPDEELVRTEFYNDFWLPQGLRDLQGIVLVRNDLWAVTLATFGHENRCFDDHSRARLVAVAGHFTRALQLSFPFDEPVTFDPSLEAAAGAGELGIVHVDRGLQVVEVLSSKGVEALRVARQPLSVASGVLRAEDPTEQSRLQEAVRRACGGEATSYGLPVGRDVFLIAVCPGPRTSPLSNERCATVLFRTKPLPASRSSAAEGLPIGLRSVVTCLEEGLGDKEIATRLDMPLATVRTYVHRAMKRLGVNSRRELMRG